MLFWEKQAELRQSGFNPADREEKATSSQIAQIFALANAVRAMAAAAVRFLTSSLRRMCSTCLQIVPVHALRITPISWFVLPCAIQVRTSISRVVRPNEPSAFSAGISSIFIFTLCFSCFWSFHLAVDLLPPADLGKVVRILVSHCVSMPYSAGGKLFGPR